MDDNQTQSRLQEVMDEYLDLGKHVGEISFDEWSQRFKDALNEAAKDAERVKPCES